MFPSECEAFFNSKVFDSLEENQDTGTCHGVLVLYLCPPSEFPGNLKAHALLFMITASFHGLFAFLTQFMCWESLVIQRGTLVTDVNDRSV